MHNACKGERSGGAAMGPGGDDNFWDMLNEIARVQAAMGQDMVAWAQVYERAGEALQRNAETAALMAEVGRRGERFMRNGPSNAARQALNLFMNPLGALGVNPGGTPPGGAAGPFARFWEAWSSAAPGGAPQQPPPPPASGGENGDAGP